MKLRESQLLLAILLIYKGMFIMAKTDGNVHKISNIEEVFSKTRTVAESLNKKGSLCIELSRKRVEYLDAKTKLSKAYEKFGKLQFSASLGEDVDENEYASAVADITALKERMETLSEELDGAKVVKDTDDLKREAEELKQEVKIASKEAKEVIIQQAKDVLKAVQNSVKANNIPVQDGEEIEVEFKEADKPAPPAEDE